MSPFGDLLYVFPAYVGMSPTMTRTPAWHPSVPRIRGDEPLFSSVGMSYTWCSPHTWG